MNYLELLKQIFQVCIIPLLGILTAFVVNFIKVKTSDLKSQYDNELFQKYLTLLSDTVVKCVLATQQTYVDTLKKEGKFDAEAQKKAFQMTLDSILSILNDDAKEFLTSAVGDLNIYIGNLIEAQVKMNKIAN